MKTLFRWTIALTVACGAAVLNPGLMAQMFGQSTRISNVVTIHADGSCQVDSRSTQTRKALEMQMRVMDQMNAIGDSDDAGNTPPAAPQTHAPAKALTDEEFKKKVLDFTELQHGDEDSTDENQFHVELDKDNVTVLVATPYLSVEEMLKGSRQGMAQELPFTGYRFEQDTNGNLRVTISPQPEMKRMYKAMKAAWKATDVRLDLKFVFPGKVLSSSFAETQSNATWMTLDSKKEESLDAFMKLMDGPVVITAESGGLTLKEPLDSQKLARAGRSGSEAGDDLPLTEGGAGFVSQPVGVVTTAIHVFPGGSNFFKEGNPTGRAAGAVVSGKVFPPKGRTLQSLSDVRLVKAVDDKGRAIEAAVAESDEGETVITSGMMMGTGKGTEAVPFQISLKLPLPDAQAIDEFTAQAVAVTAGDWKETTVTNLTETSTNDFDLGSVLPGAKLTITKLKYKNNNLRIDARLSGPTTIRRLEIQAKAEGVENQFPGVANERKFTSKGNESTRVININTTVFNPNGSPVAGPFILQIRYPEDLRRDKITIKLKGLDLL